MRATLGNVIDIPIFVTNLAETLVDPATIEITIRQPDGTTVGPFTPVHDSAGTFHYGYEPPATAAMATMHRYRIVTTNPDAAYEGEIYFEPSPFLA